MRTFANNTTLVDHHDAIRQAKRGPAMRHKNRRPAFHDRAQRVVNQFFGCRVNRRGGVIEYENARVSQDGSGQCNSLTLTTRDCHAPLPHHGVVPLRQRVDKGMHTRYPSCCLNFLLRCIRSCVCNVGSHGVREEEGFLERDADLMSQRVERHITYVNTIDADRARGRVVEPRQESGYGRLARPARTDESYDLSRLHMQVKSIEHGLSQRVAKANTFETHITAHVGQRLRVGALGDQRRRIQHIEYAFGSGPRLLRGRKNHGHHPHRRHQLNEVRREQKKGTEAETTVN